MNTRSRAVNTAKRILVIPDTQCAPDQDFTHLRHVGQYAVDQQVDYLVHLGDHWDMPSLSSYDKGKKSFEGRRYVKDIDAGNEALDILMEPIHKEVTRRKKGKRKNWDILNNLHYAMGNHEHRIHRAVEDNAELECLMSYDDFNLAEHGFQVHDFLSPFVIEGICFQHYFTSGIMGRPVTSAQAMLNKKHMSTVMGHVQDRQIAYAKKADGSRITGLFAGICYKADQGYLAASEGTSTSWSGVWVLNECDGTGAYDEMPVSLAFLERKYGSEDWKR